MTLPVSTAVALVILVTMGRPILYRDERAGREGRSFSMFKFRTMRPLREGEQMGADDHKRITRVGRLLRATSLDELPALINVFVGDMSLVGPRPLPARYVPRYSPQQARRLLVLPGVTGWAQVNGRNALGWNERFELDVWYVDNRNLALDLRILARTVANVVGRKDISHEGHATMPEFWGSEPR